MTFEVLKLNLKTRRPLIAGMAVLALFGSLVAGRVFAADPRFNFEPSDQKTLSLANRTQNTGWQNYGVSAAANDQVAFQVYYRNGVADSVAYNTRVRLTFSTTAQNTLVVNVGLSADNAPAVNDSVTINSAVAQRLTFQTNNIRWYPDRAATPTIISASSSGNGYVEVNLGDVGPCWEHQGYVTFYAGLAPEVHYNLSINKTVRNITLNQTDFYESTNASSGDQLEFQIRVQNTGDGALLPKGEGDLDNVLISDSLPYRFSYVANSTRLDGLTIIDGIVGAGINIGTLNVGATAVITFQAIINSCSENQTLTNYARAQADQISSQSDTATIGIVARTCVGGSPVIRPET